MRRAKQIQRRIEDRIAVETADDGVNHNEFDDLDEEPEEDIQNEDDVQNGNDLDENDPLLAEIGGYLGPTQDINNDQSNQLTSDQLHVKQDRQLHLPLLLISLIVLLGLRLQPLLRDLDILNSN